MIFDQSPDIKEIAAAMSAAQAAGLMAIKGKDNSQARSKYADTVDIWEAIRPVCKEHGIAVAQSVGAIRKEGDYYVQACTTQLMHGPSGQWMRSTGEFLTPLNPKLPLAWASASATSYIKRHALCAMLGVVTGDDDDLQEIARHGSEAPTVPVKAASVSLDEEHPWTKYVADGWKDYTWADGRKLGAIAPDERRKFVVQCIDEGTDNDGLKAMIFDQFDRFVRNLGESIGAALATRGWTASLDPNDWTLAQTRDANLCVRNNAPTVNPL